MHAPVAGGLRHGPTVRPAGRVDRQVLGAAPEVLRRVLRREPVRLHMHGAVDRHRVRRLSEPQHLRVEADVDVVAVRARLERHRVPLGAELVGLLLPEDRVQPALDDRRRHRRVEHGDVRAEIDVPGRAAHRRDLEALRRGAVAGVLHQLDGVGRRGGRHVEALAAVPVDEVIGAAALVDRQPLLVGAPAVRPQVYGRVVGGRHVADVHHLTLVVTVPDADVAVVGRREAPLLGGGAVAAVLLDGGAVDGAGGAGVETLAAAAVDDRRPPGGSAAAAATEAGASWVWASAWAGWTASSRDAAVAAAAATAVHRRRSGLVVGVPGRRPGRGRVSAGIVSPDVISMTARRVIRASGNGDASGGGGRSGARAAARGEALTSVRDLRSEGKACQGVGPVQFGNGLVRSADRAVVWGPGTVRAPRGGWKASRHADRASAPVPRATRGTVGPALLPQLGQNRRHTSRRLPYSSSHAVASTGGHDRFLMRPRSAPYQLVAGRRLLPPPAPLPSLAPERNHIPSAQRSAVRPSV